MRIVFFSTQPYDRVFFERHNEHFSFDLHFIEAQLNGDTVSLAQHADGVCVFVNDRVTKEVLIQLAAMQIKIIALRCAGFNNIDLTAAAQYGIKVVRVPAYSPHAVAEHALALIMTLNRKTHKAYSRVREQNFSLNGLMGFDLYGKTIGIIGTGNIGKAFALIALGLGCHVIASDVTEDHDLVKLGVTYKRLDELLQLSDILSLHCPLNEQTRYLINKQSIATMKKGVMIINTSRGALIDTRAVIDDLKSGHIGALGIDVYEQEEKLFFHDLSEKIIDDDIIGRLMSFPNVVITAHQGFFTQEALTQIAITTLSSLQDFNNQRPLVHEVKR